jgi:hypothetical protein
MQMELINLEINNVEHFSIFYLHKKPLSPIFAAL